MNESLAELSEQLMEEVCERENCLQVYKRIQPGHRGRRRMTIEEYPDYLHFLVSS